VIPGWTEGLQKINQGGKIKLYIPAALGYGDQGTPNIPPGSLLVFEVELLEVKTPPAPEAAPALPAVPAPAQ
jgi:FKBP-type peptidyl-prolyl cis-trans isomerase